MLTIEVMLAVLSFGLTCFALGYAIGSNDDKTQKQPPSPEKRGGYLLSYLGLTVYRQHLSTNKIALTTIAVKYHYF